MLFKVLRVDENRKEVRLSPGSPIIDQEEEGTPTKEVTE
jgi:hypothetical protein